jgi:hypothetical protein
MVAAHLPRLSWTKPDDPELGAKARAFCNRFAKLAFRRELDEEERGRYIDAFFDSSGDPRAAARASVMAVLKSPWFLYLGLNEGHPESVAESLAWTMADSLPDKAFAELGQKLQSNPDDTEAILAAFDDPRVRNKWNEFFLTWFRIRDGASISKDTDAFAGFDEQLVDDLQSSAFRLVEEVVWSDTSDLRQLLLADHVWLNHRLANFYFPKIADSLAEQPEKFQAITLEDSGQAGLLTHPLLLSQLAYFRSSSPIYRGVFVSRNLMGIPLKPPPVAVEPLGEDFDPNMTTRERVEFQTRPENCMSCHQVINPLGFALERFDAVGRLRETDRDRPINDAVMLSNADGANVEIAGARELAEYLVRQRETARHFVETVFHHAVKQPVAAYGEGELDRLTDDFIQNEYNIKKLIVEIAASVALYDRNASESGESDVD